VASGTLAIWLARQQSRVSGSAPILVAGAIAGEKPEWMVMVVPETQRCTAIAS
jgi:hypothetical protein